MINANADDLAAYKRLRGQALAIARKMQDASYTAKTLSQLRAERRVVCAGITRLHVKIFYSNVQPLGSTELTAHPTRDRLSTREPRSRAA